MKDAGILLGREKKQRDFFGGGVAKKGLRDFWVMPKKSNDFLGRQILKL